MENNDQEILQLKEEIADLNDTIDDLNVTGYYDHAQILMSELNRLEDQLDELTD